MTPDEPLPPVTHDLYFQLILESRLVNKALEMSAELFRDSEPDRDAVERTVYKAFYKNVCALTRAEQKRREKQA
jgi:hypothetical protein